MFNKVEDVYKAIKMEYRKGSGSLLMILWRAMEKMTHAKKTIEEKK